MRRIAGNSLIFLALAFQTLRVRAIYPSDHWTYSKELTTSNFEESIQSEISAGKTVFVRWIASEGWGWWRKQAPAWNAVTKSFKDNPDVAFMDINMSKERITTGPDGIQYGPGRGGWPTIKYFNTQTGMAGGAYKQKMEVPICTELGDVGRMTSYIEEYSKTSAPAGSDGEL